MSLQSVRRHWPAIAIVVIGGLAYVPAYTAAFVWDDHSLVESSTLLRGPLWRIWFTATAKDYWPLTWTSLWLEWRLWGASPTGYHVVNVGLHLATSLLLWRLLARLRVPGAPIAALLFAVHPATVESVAWISERKNVLSSVFLLGAAHQWLSFEATGSRRRWGAACVLFATALLAKASVVMFPVAVITWRLWSGGRIARRDVVETAPLFALSLVAGIMTVWFQHHNALAGFTTGRTLVERIGGAGWALASYLEIAFVPVRIGVVYPAWPATPGSLPWVAPLAALAALFAGLWLTRRWLPARATLAALSFHAVMVLPVLGLVDMAYLAVGPVSNHLQYVAIAGPMALAGAAAHVLIRRSRAAAVAVAAVVALAASVTWTRASAFESDETLWARAVKEQPGSAAAHFQRAQLLLAAGRVAEAMPSLAAVERLASTSGARLRARMQRQWQSGEHEQAIDTARQIVRVERDPDVRRDAALTLLAGDETREAIEVLAALVRAVPASPDYTYWLAAGLMRSGRADDAAAVLRAFALRRPGNPQIEQAYAFVLLRNGRLDEARARAAAVAGVAPDDRRAEAQLEQWMAQGGWR